MLRKNLISLLSLGALLGGLACSSPSSQPDTTLVPPPSVVINTPVDQVIKVVTTEERTAQFLKDHPGIFQVGANGEAWINRGWTDLPNTHLRVHIVPMGPSATTVSLGFYSDDGNTRTARSTAAALSERVLVPLKAYFDQGLKGDAPSVIAGK